MLLVFSATVPSFLILSSAFSRLNLTVPTLFCSSVPDESIAEITVFSAACRLLISLAADVLNSCILTLNAVAASSKLGKLFKTLACSSSLLLNVLYLSNILSNSLEIFAR